MPTLPKFMPKNPNSPSNDNDVEKIVDFVGVQELNVGKSDDEPNF